MEYKYCKRTEDDEQGDDKGWYEPRAKTRARSRLNPGTQSLIRQKPEALS